MRISAYISSGTRRRDFYAIFFAYISRRSMRRSFAESPRANIFPQVPESLRLLPSHPPLHASPPSVTCYLLFTSAIACVLPPGVTCILLLSLQAHCHWVARTSLPPMSAHHHKVLPALTSATACIATGYYLTLAGAYHYTSAVTCTAIGRCIQLLLASSY